MNKLTKVLSVFIIAGVIGTGAAGIAGCKKDNGTNHTHSYSYTDNADGTHNGTCDCGKEPITNEAHVDADGNKVCDKCDAAITSGEQHTHKYTYTDNGDGTHKGVCTCGKDTIASEAHTWGDDNKCTKCEAVKPSEGEDDKYMDVTYSVNITEKFESAKTEEERKVSIFTVGSNTEVRNRTKSLVYANEENGAQVSDASYTKSIKLGGTADAFYINAPEAGELIIHVQNGSSGVTSWQKLVLTKPDGTTEEVSYSAHNASPIREVKIPLAAKGKYSLTRTSGTSDIFYAQFKCRVKDTPLDSIEVVGAGTTSYFVGQTYTKSGIELNKVYSETMRTEPLELDDEGLVVDDSAVDTSKSGIYKVNLTYNDGEKDYKASIDVTVYAVESLSLGKNAIKDGIKNSYNGIYVNQHLRELYILGEKFSSEGLTVTVRGAIGEGADKKTQDFLIKSGYTISGNDISSAGKKTVTVTLDGTTVKDIFEVYVISGIEDLTEAKSVAVKVDAVISDNAVGTKNSTNEYQFKTIHQALEFLESCGIPDDAEKTITLAAGLYNEKLEVNIPNLTIIGAGTGETAYSMIEWDSLFGERDESGYVHTTDSTSTLNISEKAVGFTMKNVIVSNYFNCKEHFDERMGEGFSEHRALAMLVQADKVTVENCTLLGYQDTLELFTGRHVFKNCLIEGVTDFIFGSNGTTYFTGCEIRQIRHVKANQGGYMTAFKGTNGSGTKVTYGAIFDDCDFTAEEGVPAGLSAIGRAWGADAAVMVMNSRIGGHIAKNTSRYVGMGAGEPKDAQFLEYNNTGAGAVETPVQVGTGDAAKNLWDVPAAADAVKYADVYTIFAMTNNQVTYKTSWAGTNEKVTITLDAGALDGASIAVYKNVKITKALAEELFAIEGYILTGVYTDAERTIAFEYGTPLTADINLYATYEDADPTVNQNFSYAYVSGSEVKSQGKIKFDGLAANGDWIRFAADTDSIHFTAIKGTVVTLGVYTGTTGLLINDGTEREVLAENGAVTFTVAADGEVVIKRKAGDGNAYFKTISIMVPVKDSYKYVYAAGGRPDGTAETSDGKLEFSGCLVNNSWLRFSADTSYIKFVGVSGTTIKISTYDNSVLLINGTEVTPVEKVATYEVTEDGVITIARKAGTNLYISGIEFDCPVTEVTYTYTYGGENDAAWTTEGNPVTTQSTDATPVTALKLEPTKCLVLTATGTKATVSATGFTTSSGNASKFLKIDFLDAGGNVVGTLEGTTTAGKVNGAYTFENNVVTASAEFVSVKIYCGVAGKGTGLVNLSITVE